MARPARLALLLYGLAAGVYVLDRLSKVWAEGALAGEPSIDLTIFDLRYTTNSGGAFGIGGSAPLLFALATLVVVGVIVSASTHLDRATMAVGLGLVLGGAIGNLTDRLVRGDGLLDGRVVDFIDFRVWPVFNLADSAIVLGAIVLLVGSLRRPRPEPDAAP